MKQQTVFFMVWLLKTSLTFPVQLGILASNSNEILRLNGMTLATLGQTQVQASQLLPQYVLQQQPDVLFTPQVMNFNPQMAGPFIPQGPQLFPAQGNQLNPVLIPNGQQEQVGPGQDPNMPLVPQQAQNPQMVPQYQYPVYGYPQQPRMQGFPYYMPHYGYPNQRNPMVLQPNNGQVVQPQQNLRPTLKPQLPLQQAVQSKANKIRPVGTQKAPTMPPPDQRGDNAGPGVDEGHPNFPFLFDP